MRFVGVGAWQYWRWREQFLRANGLKALVWLESGLGTALCCRVVAGYL
jgi:hypothetical protein